MNVQEQIRNFIASHPEPKSTELQDLHKRTLSIAPKTKLWFFDGTDEQGKTVTNPTIGYGNYTIKYANGTTKDSFRIGISANKTGISVYILGIKDKAYLAQTFGKDLGKASVTGYCIKFKSLKDINLDTLEAAIRFGLEMKE